MSKQIGSHHGPRKATLLPACFAGLLCASIPFALATAQTNTTTTTTTAGGQTTVVEETTTTTTQPATTTVVRQPHPLGPAGVGVDPARRTARRTTRRLN